MLLPSSFRKVTLGMGPLLFVVYRLLDRGQGLAGHGAAEALVHAALGKLLADAIQGLDAVVDQAVVGAGAGLDERRGGLVDLLPRRRVEEVAVGGERGPQRGEDAVGLHALLG